MSIALDRGGGERFEGGCGGGYMRGGMAPSCIVVFESAEMVVGLGDRREMKLKEDLGSDSCSSSSSSIGKNSDLSERSSSDGGEDSGEAEVQSSFKGPLDALDALEETLPMRRGISKFYNGKSKSFASLNDAPGSSIKEIVKPENAYSRKRRNLLAYTQGWDKNRGFPLRSNGGGISKRPLHSSRSTLALAVAMSNSSDSNSSSPSNSKSNSRSSPPLPPLHPHTRPLHSNASSVSPSSPPLRRNFQPWRSFSLTDLQDCATASVGPANTSGSPCSMGEDSDIQKLT